MGEPPTRFDWNAAWRCELDQLAEQGLVRRLRTVEAIDGHCITIDGRRLLSFASNDYLGLAGDPRIVQAVSAAAGRWGWGAGASRLISGSSEPHRRLERRLAEFKGTQAALVCSTGYQANLAALAALAGPDALIVLDKLDHASIIDAAFRTRAEVRVYPHRDLRKAERLLAMADGRRAIIVTDSLFSMDGDLADLPALVELKHRYGALLVVDEAHATGVLGEHGRGAAELLGVEAGIDVTVGTLSKALGGIGGFIAGPAEVVELAVNRAGPFIFTTAIPPAACAAAEAALDVVAAEPQRRRTLSDLSARLSSRLAAAGLDLGTPSSPALRPTPTPIIPVVVGGAKEALALSAALEAEGFLVPAIRPPTVPRGRSRLRISLSAAHKLLDVDRLGDTIVRLIKELSSMAGPASDG